MLFAEKYFLTRIQNSRTDTPLHMNAFEFEFECWPIYQHWSSRGFNKRMRTNKTIELNICVSMCVCLFECT